MDPQIYSALIALTLVLLTGLTAFVGWVFKMAPAWIERAINARLLETEKALEHNTELTRDVQKQTNGARIALEQRLMAKDAELHRKTMLLNALEMDEEGRRALTKAHALLDGLRLTPKNTTQVLSTLMDEEPTK